MFCSTFVIPEMFNSDCLWGMLKGGRKKRTKKKNRLSTFLVKKIPK